MSAVSASKVKRSSALTLILLALAFLTPTLGAWLLYQYMSGQGTVGSAAHGQLLLPARTVPVLELTAPGGTPLSTETLRGKWTMLYFAPNPCSADCTARLDDIRQIRLAAGEDMRRVQRLWVMTTPPSEADLASIRVGHPELLLAEVPDTVSQEFYSSFLEMNGDTATAEGRVYLLDPLANVVLRYGPEVPPRGCSKI
jgi:peroxiredoxin